MVVLTLHYFKLDYYNIIVTYNSPYGDSHVLLLTPAFVLGQVFLSRNENILQMKLEKYIMQFKRHLLFEHLHTSSSFRLSNWCLCCSQSEEPGKSLLMEFWP